MILTMEIVDWAAQTVQIHTSEHVDNYDDMMDLIEAFTAQIKFGEKTELRLIISREYISE